MRLNDAFDRITLINLDRRTDRLERFDGLAKENNFTYDRFSAIDAEAYEITPRLACSLSHQAVLKQAMNDNLKNILIFEDDAAFVKDFQGRFSQAYSELPADWDMFYLGAWHLSHRAYSRSLVKMIESYCTHAYAVNGKYLESAHKTAQLPLPIDIAYSQRHPQINAFAAYPSISVQVAGYSDIDKEDKNLEGKI